MPRVKEYYDQTVSKELGKKFGYKKMDVPKLEKIVVSMGVGKAIGDSKLIEAAVNDLMIITGQRPSIRKATKAISNFKLREGMPVGVSVTLRNKMMYEFFDRLMNVAAPRIRDFRGFKTDGFDGRGNYNFGLTEQIVFPEIDYDKVYTIMGMNITIVTTANTDEEARSLLELMGVPFRKSSTEKAGA
ncbi:50S ribosomal protein L5 [candidate division WOR-3 bacterium]|nr:50S ribosomal protein L5 [candidate division WOR-3 bacterium]